MKASMITLLALFLSLSAHAIGISCTYSEEPCNDQGYHYACYTYAWSATTICSSTDISRRYNQRPKEDFTCADCYSQPRPSQQCKDECNCYSAFCGSW